MMRSVLKLAALALLAACLPIAAHAQLTGCSGYSSTTNFGLGLPTLHATGWGSCVQSDLSAIDQLLLNYGAGGGTAQAQTVTLSSAITAYRAGLVVRWLPAAANTGAGPTLNVNGLGAVTIVKEPGNAALVANDLTTSAVATALYDGTNFELQDPQTSTSGAGTGSCTSQLVSAVNSGSAPTCTTVVAADTDTSIAKTGADINTSSQVTNLSHVSNSSLANNGLANPSITVNGQPCALGTTTCNGYAAGGGTAQAQTVTLAPAAAAYAAGMTIRWLPIAANTATAPTVNVNGLGAKTIVKEPGNAALVANDLTTASIAVATYDGTNFELLDPQTSASGAGTGSCTNQLVSAVNSGSAPTCATVVAADTDSSIAKTGTDINTSNQVTNLSHVSNNSLPSAGMTTVGTAGSCGDATHSCALTFDAEGRETAQANDAIALPQSVDQQTGTSYTIPSGDLAGEVVQRSNAAAMTDTLPDPSAAGAYVIVYNCTGVTTDDNNGSACASGSSGDTVSRGTSAAFYGNDVAYGATTLVVGAGKRCYLFATSTTKWHEFCTSTSSGAGTTTNALTGNASGGAAPGSTFNGSSPVTFDYHTLGAAPAQVPVVLDTTTPVTVSTTNGAEVHNNQNATAATAVTYNLPTAAAGKQFCFTNSNNGTSADTGVLTLQTSATGQFIIFTDGTLSATDGNVTSGGAAADAACVVGVDATHWQLYVQRGTWTKH